MRSTAARRHPGVRHGHARMDAALLDRGRHHHRNRSRAVEFRCRRARVWGSRRGRSEGRDKPDPGRSGHLDRWRQRGRIFARVATAWMRPHPRSWPRASRLQRSVQRSLESGLPLIEMATVSSNASNTVVTIRSAFCWTRWRPGRPPPERQPGGESDQGRLRGRLPQPAVDLRQMQATPEPRNGRADF